MTAESELNLYTEGEGIFGTHVTWDDIERNMQKSLGTSATFGEAKTIKNVGDGNGFMSRICLVDADWHGEQPGENLPKKFIAKICTAVTMVAFSKKMAEKNKMEGLLEQFTEVFKNMSEQVKDFHNTEINIYNLFDKHGLLEKMHAAKIYHKQKFGKEEPLKGHIIMEYMDKLESIHICNNIAPEMLHVPMRSLAVMEATSLHFTDEERSWFKTKPIQEIFGQMFTDENRRSDAANAKTVRRRKTRSFGMQPVLCHGDFWSTNILWRKEGDDTNVAAIIDYHTSHFGNPVGDLCRLFATVLSGPDRRAHWEDLLETFYGFLLEELNGEEAPYTLEQLKRAYHLYYPIGAYLVVPIIGPMFEVICSSPDPEVNKKTLEVVAEKSEYLLEDMISFYEEYKNNNIK